MSNKRQISIGEKPENMNILSAKIEVNRHIFSYKLTGL
jgi:hypothetical protein